MDTPDQPDILLFGPFRLDRRGGGLFRHTEDGTLDPVALGSRALDVLWVLVERHGDLVSKDEIMAAVWPSTVVEESNLSVQISVLRRTLGSGRSDANRIQTVPGRGYRFIGSVTRLVAAARFPPPGTMFRQDTPSAPASHTASPPRWWVGRSVLLETLDKSLRQALTGNHQVVFITGEAGIGKTTLVEMAIERMSVHGVGVLWGNCVERFGTEEAFLPLIDALLEGCRGACRTLLLTALRDHAPTWLAQMPDLLETEDRATFQSKTFGATRERMLREFCDFLEILSSDRPWVIVLEDLHWSDFATLDVLSRFARRSRKASVLILATYRPIDVMATKHPIEIVHQDLQIHGRCADLALDQLSLANVGQYLALRFGDPAFVQPVAEWVFARTKGHPLFVVTLVDYLITEKSILHVDGHWRLGLTDAMPPRGLPRDLRDMITRQLDRLSADEIPLLEVASAAGAEFSAAVVAGAMDMDILAVERIFEALARREHVLTTAAASEWPDGTFSGGYSFRHAFYQEILYQGLAPGQRARAHRRLGERLEAGYQDRTADIASVLALHFEAGRDFVKATHYLGQAAESSAKRFSNREAANYLSRALDLLKHFPAADQAIPRISLLQQRARVRRAAGDLVGSFEDLNEMIAHAVEARQVGMEVSGLLDLSRFSFLADRRQCLRAAERALAKSQELEDDIFRISVQGSIASISLYIKGWAEEDARLCQHAIKMTAGARDPRILMRRCVMEGILKCMRADYLDCRSATALGKALALEIGDVYSFSLYNTLDAVALIHLGEWRELLRNTTATLAMADRNANQEADVLARLTIAWLHAEALDFEGARERCEVIRDTAMETNSHVFFFCRTVLAKACLGLRDHAAALTQLDGITQRLEAEGIGLSYTIHAYFLHAFCEYWLETGEWDKAREQATRLHAYAAPAPDRYHLALAHELLARIAIAEGNSAAAMPEVSLAIANLGDAAPPGAAWRVYLTAAACYESIGDRVMASDHRLRRDTVIRGLTANFDRDDPLHSSWLSGVAAEIHRQDTPLV